LSVQRSLRDSRSIHSPRADFGRGARGGGSALQEGDHGTKPDDTANHRNGTGGKTVLTDDGTRAIDVPRDREGTFEPRLVAKHERRFVAEVTAWQRRPLEPMYRLRHSLDYATWKERKALAVALRPIDTAPSADAAGAALDTFEQSPWGTRLSLDPRHSVFGVPPEVRRVIYTTNVLQSVRAQLRKIIKTCGHFPSDEAATKLI
jgi:transposase-like protein